MNARLISSFFAQGYTGGASTESNIDASGVFKYGPELRALQNMYGYEMYGGQGGSGAAPFSPPPPPPPGGGGGGGGGGGDGPGHQHIPRTYSTTGGGDQSAAEGAPAGGVPTGGAPAASGHGASSASAQDVARRAALTNYYLDQHAQQWLAEPGRVPEARNPATGITGGTPFDTPPMNPDGTPGSDEGYHLQSTQNASAWADQVMKGVKPDDNMPVPQDSALAPYIQKYASLSSSPTPISSSGAPMPAAPGSAAAAAAQHGASSVPGSQAAPYGSSPQNVQAATMPPGSTSTGNPATFGSGGGIGAAVPPGYQIGPDGSLQPSGASPDGTPLSSTAAPPNGSRMPPVMTGPPGGTPSAPPGGGPQTYNIPPPSGQSYGITPQSNPAGAPVLDWGQQGASGNRNLAGAAAWDSARQMYSNPYLAPDVQNAIAQQGMNATRAQFAGQQGQADRRRAVTGNSAGYAASSAQMGRDQAGAYGMQARQNTIDFEKEAQRRKETAQGQMQNLYQGESQYQLGLLGGAAGVDSKLQGSDSSTRARSANSPMVSL